MVALDYVSQDRRAALAAFVAIIRNPLEALPPDVFTDGVVASRMAGLDNVFLTDPALIQEALVRNADALDKGEQVRRVLGPALGQGLLTAEGAHWRWQRQAVASGFRHDRLLAMAPTFIAAAERCRRRWLEADISRIDVGHEMMLTTFDIIVETMMSGADGIDLSRAGRAVADYLASSNWTIAFAALDLPEWLPFPGRRRAARAGAYLRGIIHDKVSQRRAAAKALPDLVELLLSARDPQGGRAMNDEEIADNLLTFMTAGHETTALGLAWTFSLLAAHPDVEARMLEEIERVRGGGGLGAHHLAELVYCRQVFSEAMRLYPPAPLITRVVRRPFTLGGFVLKEGARLTVPIYALHRHRRLWDDPERFDPDRFAPEVAGRRHRYAYMPFGAGPRICIGNAFATMEAVAILAVLLPAVRLRSLSNAPPVPTMRVTLRPRRRLMMELAPRPCDVG